MDFVNIPLFKAMDQKLKYHAARQSVLAQNVANVDTPAYRARDIKAPDFASMLQKNTSGKTMAMTSPMHMQPGMGKGGALNKGMERENTYETNPIGNNVVIEEEVMRVAENQNEYQKVLSIYRKSLEMFKIALGKGGV